MLAEYVKNVVMVNVNKTLISYIRTKRFVFIFIYVSFCLLGDYDIKSKSLILEKLFSNDISIRDKNINIISDANLNHEMACEINQKLKSINFKLVFLQFNQGTKFHDEIYEMGTVSSSWHLKKKINQLNYRKVEYLHNSKTIDAIKFSYRVPENELIISGVLY
jgi:hypothetical protein